MNTIKNSIEVDASNTIVMDLDEKAFVRTCQILESCGNDVIGDCKEKIKEIRIPFCEYDKLNSEVESSGYLNDYPDYFDEAILSKIKLVRILEIFKDQEVTSKDDLSKALINRKFCYSNSVTIVEDEENNEVVITLICS